MSDQGKRYDNIASAFAEMRDSFYREQKYLDLLINYLQPGADVLDVGCGSGHPIAAYLIEQGLKVTGIDASKKLLNIAAKKCPHMRTIHGDVRSIVLNEKYDAIVEWWCLFHLPKADQIQMISRFANWLKQNGILEFTTGDRAYEESSSAMLEQELFFYSCDPIEYESALKANGFQLLLKENDQEEHLVWIAKKVL